MPVNTTARAKSTNITVWNATASFIAAKPAPTATPGDRAVVIRAATANVGEGLTTELWGRGTLNDALGLGAVFQTPLGMGNTHMRL